MTFYAVIDTNVLVSSLLTSNPQSPTVEIIISIDKGRLTPIYSDYLLSEYEEVLSRSHFSIPDTIRDQLLWLFKQKGICIEPKETDIDMPDSEDIPIFLITMETRDLDSYLVTGNIKHYPPVDYVVTPKKMIEILRSMNK